MATEQQIADSDEVLTKLEVAFTQILEECEGRIEFSCVAAAVNCFAAWSIIFCHQGMHGTSESLEMMITMINEKIREMDKILHVK